VKNPVSLLTQDIDISPDVFFKGQSISIIYKGILVYDNSLNEESYFTHEMSKPERVFQSKIVLCGDLAVGKTSVRRNYMGLSFERDHISTLGADFSLKKVMVGKDRVDTQIWDLGGQQGYERLRRRYFSGSRGALMVFDLTQRETFDNLDYWFNQLWDCSPTKELPVLILGNKCDLGEEEFAVTEKEINAYLKKTMKKNDIKSVKFKYFQTSAKDGININECFAELAKDIHAKLLEQLGLT
jgi:small GTP-binding protein